ncbi:MAG: SAM-dependent methyltransferase, partial [Burkholderiales bacterium]
GVAGVTAVFADLEDGSPWPLEAGRFAGIVVANYLYRPLFRHLIAALAPGGVLIYETFMAGNERYGKPSKPEFLLAPGELLAAFARELTVAAFEQGRVARPKAAMIQRLCALRAHAGEVALEPLSS